MTEMVSLRGTAKSSKSCTEREEITGKGQKSYGALGRTEVHPVSGLCDRRCFGSCFFPHVWLLILS